MKYSSKIKLKMLAALAVILFAASAETQVRGRAQTVLLALGFAGAGYLFFQLHRVGPGRARRIERIRRKLDSIDEELEGDGYVLIEDRRAIERLGSVSDPDAPRQRDCHSREIARLTREDGKLLRRKARLKEELSFLSAQSARQPAGQPAGPGWPDNLF